MHLQALAAFSPLSPQVTFPNDFQTNLLMLFRWVHLLAGVTWLGLLYFFNLVNVPFMKEIDSATKGKVVPALMSRASGGSAWRPSLPFWLASLIGEAS